MENQLFQNANYYYRLRNISDHSVQFSFGTSNGDINGIEIPPNHVYTDIGKNLMFIKEQSLNTKINDGSIQVIQLSISKNESYTLRNGTAHPITIKHFNFSKDSNNNIFIPPFDAITLFGYELKDFSFEEWLGYKLISFEGNIKLPVDDIFQRLVIILSILLTLFLGISIPLMIVSQDTAAWLFIIISVAIVSILIIMSFWLISRYIRINEEWSSSFRAVFQSLQPKLVWLNLSPGFFLILLVSIGIPIAVVYFLGDGENLLKNFISGSYGEKESILFLFRIFQTFFIVTVSMLPALFYYLFGRQLTNQKKVQFIRDALSLDPTIHSVPETQAKYGILLDSIYGSGNSPLQILLLILSTALFTMGWLITFQPFGPLPIDMTTLGTIFAVNPSTFSMGFLGAYFFAINMVYRRYTRKDLTPNTYAFIIVRFLVIIILIMVIGMIPTDSASQNSLLLISFVIGIFPEVGLTIVSSLFQKITSVNLKNKDVLMEDELALTNLEGLSKYDEAQLSEEGINNIENLAHHNLMEVIGRTRIPVGRLVDMIDQAILYLRIRTVKYNDQEQPQDKLTFQEKLKTLGVRTASDLYQLVRNIRNSSLNKYELLISAQDFANIALIADALKDDEWMAYILKWRHSRGSNPIVDEPIKIINWELEDWQST